MAFRFYTAAMSREERQAAEEMLAGFTALQPSVRTLHLGVKQLYDVYYRMKLDNPRICYVKNISFRGVRDADHLEVIPEYAFEPKKIRTVLASVDARVKKIASPMASMSEAEKERYVHDFLTDSITYDKLYKNYAHEVIGPLCHGIGVCEGIAKTAKLLFDAVGIDSAVLIGEADDSVDGIAGMRHAWNLVWIGRKPYHLDVTFDNSLTRCGLRRYDYYNLSDGEIFRDHRALVYPAPACTDAAGSYYRQVQLYAADGEALEKLLRLAKHKRKNVLAFRCDAPYEEIARISGEIAARRGKTARLSMNPAQRVFLLTFGAAVPQGETNE